MAEIKLQFVLQGDFSSKVIAWFSQGHFSHVDAVWHDGEQLLGARSDNPHNWGHGVQLRQAGYAKFARRVVFTIPCTPIQHMEWQKFLRAQLGKPYDMSAIWAFALGRNWRHQGSWICSELQARALEFAGLLPELYLACNKITPVALALVVSAMPGVKHEQLSD